MVRTRYIQWDDDDDVHYVLDQHSLLEFCSANFYSSLQVDTPLHWDTLSWFWAYQYLLLLIKAACLEEKQHIPIYSIWFDWTVTQTHDLTQ